MTPLKIGLIGANWALKGPGPAWMATPGAEISAVCTRHRSTAEAAVKALGAGYPCWDYRELLADPGVDAISISTKPSARYEIVMAALAAGKHVFQAVPFAVDLERAQKMRDLQRANGLVGVVDAHWRWLPAVMRMKQMIEEGFLGRFCHATLNVHLPLIRHGDFVYPLPAWSRGDTGHNWLGEASSGAGAWRNSGTHAAILLDHLFGPVAEAVGHAETLVDEWRLPDGSTFRPQTEDVGAALVRFTRGGAATISTSWNTPDAAGLYLEAWGTHGRLLMRSDSFAGGDARLFAGDAAPRDYLTVTAREVDVAGADGFTAGQIAELRARGVIAPIFSMVQDMARAIRSGGDGAPSFDDAWRAQQVIEAVIRSKKTRRWEPAAAGL